ncbi:MAG: hypothetical protein PHT07_15075 [Paludibacter sp.]|nr:hypothetical protein [Paludibacter sp.]
MKKKWIQAIGMQKGAFTKKAKRAGMTVPQYEREVLKKSSKASSTTKKQAVLSRTLRGLRKKNRG